MKKGLARITSVFLAITIVFSSAYVGLSELDLNGIFDVKAKAASVDDLIFELNDDGESYCVDSCDEATSGEIVIPDTYNGLPVTGIDYSAFRFVGEKITSVSIPSSIEFIDDYAFQNCTNIESVYITDIDAWCKIEFGYWSGTPLAYNAKLYLNGESIKKVEIPKGVTTIHDNLFYNCDELVLVTIPDTVTSIGESAFENCISLESVEIPDSVKSISFSTFANCINLMSVRLSNSLTSIPVACFMGCKNLTYVKIPGTVKQIEIRAFYGCTSLKSVSLPMSIKEIHRQSFGYYSDTNGVDRKVNEFSINGYSNTVAQKYASDNGLAFVEIESICSHISIAWIIETEAGCVDDGYKYSTCIDCGELLVEEIIPAKGSHTESDWIIEEATCEKDGYKYKECIVCGDSLEYEDIPATESHLESEWIVEEEPTCEEYGYKYKECIWCGEFLDEGWISPRDHNYVEGYCSYPGCKYSLESKHPYEDDSNAIWVINKAGANYIAITFSEDTETEYGFDFIYIYDGYENRIGIYTGTELAGETIAVQGDTVKIKLVSDESIGEYGFSIDNVEAFYETCNHTETEIQNFYEPSCISEGYSGDIYCIKCGTIVSSGNSIEATGEHKFLNGFCSVCGVQDSSYVMPVLKVGETQVATIQNSDTAYYFLFVPQNDGVYSFESDSFDEDTYGRIFDSEHYILVTDDDGGRDENFKLRYFLEAGEEYIIECEYYSESTVGSFDVSCDYVFYALEGTRVSEEYVFIPCLTKDISDFIMCSDAIEFNYAASLVTPNNNFWGTGSQFYYIDCVGENDYYEESVYNIIVEGDLNGDSVCDVIDTSAAYLYSVGLQEPTQKEILAANGYDSYSFEFDATSYQNVVNMMLGS